MIVFLIGIFIRFFLFGFSFIDVIMIVVMFVGFNELEKWKDKDDKYDLLFIKYLFVFLWINGINVFNYNVFCVLYV